MATVSPTFSVRMVASSIGVVSFTSAMAGRWYRGRNAAGMTALAGFGEGLERTARVHHRPSGEGEVIGRGWRRRRDGLERVRDQRRELRGHRRRAEFAGFSTDARLVDEIDAAGED